jgi:magnesium-protoporphyrin O-methyltransferase
MSAVTDSSYAQSRERIETYFDRTAVEAWKRLTSDAPVGRIRATVRAGRDQMRRTLLDWLPADLRGKRLLDAGCGTGMLAVEAARRGARVVAVDLSPTLVELARERLPHDIAVPATEGRIDFLAGDMLDASLGEFDHVVAMDSLIHYRTRDVVDVLCALTARTRGSMLFTFAPRTPLLAAMHAIGQVFPRGNRSPAIEPVSELALVRAIAAQPGLEHWQPSRTARITRGFYISQALELARRGEQP